MTFTPKHLLTTGASLLALGVGSAQADILHLDDVIISFSLCAGNDCVNGENFGFDTIRMKENNLRMHFDDTSTSASFPRNDWRLIANDSSNGGASYLAIEDSTAGRIPFRVEAGAPVNTLYVEADGDVGIKTANPVVDLHVVEGNTPTLRLEQDGSDGFTPQTYDIAANEANFFIRDVTNGSKLFFRSKPGAPEDSIFIAADGDIGLNTDSPSAALHVVRSTGNAAEMLRVQNNGGSYLTLQNTASGADWFFTHENNAAGRFIINNSTNPAEGLFLDPDGDMTIGGTLTENSDKHSKMAIVPVDTAEILDKVSALPVSAWTYKDDTSGARHVGPMAQDFYAAFGLGHTDKGIATLDTSGVALASIKALHDENEELKARISALEALIQD